MLYEVLYTPILITDRDSVIAVAGMNKKDFLGKTVGISVEQAMAERKIINRNTDAKNNLSGIIQEHVEELDKHFNRGLIVPIIAQGDPIGAVVVCSKVDLGEIESKVARSMAGILAKQMEF